VRPRLLPGTVCIITGGGRGIGRITAELLAAQGANLAICARSSSELAEVADKIEASTGRRPLAPAVDVTDWHAVRCFADAVFTHLGPPTLLVNNAAVLGPVGPITDCDLDSWARTLTVNVAGVAAMSAAVASRMVNGGAIVNLSGGGIGGPRIAPLVSAYTSSKAAVVTLTETLARELAPRGITVNSVAPGPVATRFMEPVLAAGPEVAGELYDLTVDQRRTSSPLDLFVDLICYLASPEGRWLSGRLLSARWDQIEALESRRASVEGGSLLQLRRIDDALYGEFGT
jgi:NAD(P)-dependent dehydrogenase (short-subunit alcohol dehydrogenase family)